MLGSKKGFPEISLVEQQIGHFFKAKTVSEGGQLYPARHLGVKGRDVDSYRIDMRSIARSFSDYRSEIL